MNYLVFENMTKVSQAVRGKSVCVGLCLSMSVYVPISLRVPVSLPLVRKTSKM